MRVIFMATHALNVDKKTLNQGGKQDGRRKNIYTG